MLFLCLLDAQPTIMDCHTVYLIQTFLTLKKILYDIRKRIETGHTIHFTAD